MPFTTDAKNEMLENQITGTMYFALVTAEPSATDTGSTITEVSGGSYARKSIDTSVVFDAAASGSKALNQNVEFVAATGSWGTVTHICLVDASTAGELVCWVDATDQAVVSGNIYRVTGFTATIS